MVSHFLAAQQYPLVTKPTVYTVVNKSDSIIEFGYWIRFGDWKTDGQGADTVFKVRVNPGATGQLSFDFHKDALGRVLPNTIMDVNVRYFKGLDVNTLIDKTSYNPDGYALDFPIVRPDTGKSLFQTDQLPSIIYVYGTTTKQRSEYYINQADGKLYPARALAFWSGNIDAAKYSNPITAVNDPVIKSMVICVMPKKDSLLQDDVVIH
jgi:hypothetical protein